MKYNALYDWLAQPLNDKVKPDYMYVWYEINHFDIIYKKIMATLYLNELWEAYSLTEKNKNWKLHHYRNFRNNCILTVKNKIQLLLSENKFWTKRKLIKDFREDNDLPNKRFKKEKLDRFLYENWVTNSKEYKEAELNYITRKAMKKAWWVLRYI